MNPLDISASGLAAQWKRLEVIARNLANAETTRTPGGGPYQRQEVVFAEQVEALGEGGVEVAEVIADPTSGRRVYQPGHPDADGEGYVTYPNVTAAQEMVDMIAATRSYEANVTAMNATKGMIRRALDLGRE